MGSGYCLLRVERVLEAGDDLGIHGTVIGARRIRDALPHAFRQTHDEFLGLFELGAESSDAISAAFSSLARDPCVAGARPVRR